MGGNVSLIITFVLYLIALLGIGYLAEKRFSKSYEDFIAGGKSFGAWVTAISSSASAESAWVMLGLSGIGYAKGISAYWAAIGCIIGYFINALFIMVPLNRRSRELGSLNLEDFVEDSTNDKSHILRIISAIIIVVFMTSYVVAQFTGAGKTMAGIGISSYKWGVIIGGLIIGIYVVMGGYASVSWTDLLQGLLMALIMLTLPVYAVIKAGGPENIIHNLSGLGLSSFTHDAKGAILWGFIIMNLGIALGYPGMPHVVMRYITARDEKETKKAAIISVIWGIVVFFGSTTLGIAGRVLLPNLKDAEHVLPAFTKGFLHPVIAGVVLSAITAAIMSTADSQLMYAATALIHDFYKKISKREMDTKELVSITRLIIVGLTLLAMIFALSNVRQIYSYVLNFAWSAMGASFGPIIFLALYYKDFNKWGALASLITGSVFTVVWSMLGLSERIIYVLIPAFFLSLLLGFLFSILTGGRKNVQ